MSDTVSAISNIEGVGRKCRCWTLKWW